MASSNRHWPSMFKSKPCNTHPHQWQHNNDINPSLVSSNGYHKASYTSGCEERSPEPKPRWNPRPEQIRILEAIFNSGMVNPPRDEIRKIRAQLQEYGQVGDANVFYWFQNRKSRSKHKHRQLQSRQQQQQQPQQQNPSSSTSNTNSLPSMITTNYNTTSIITPPPTSSSSSSDKSSPQSSVEKPFSIGSSKNFIDLSQSPTASVNQQLPSFLSESFFFPGAAASTNNFTTQGFGFSDIISASVDHHQASVVAPPPPCPTSDGLFFSDLQVLNHQEIPKKAIDSDDVEKMKLQEQQLFSSTYPLTTAPAVLSAASTIPIPSNNHQVQGGGGGGAAKSSSTVVFINDVALEVPVGPFDVRGAFGDDAVLVHYSTGEPVVVNGWGVTIQPLQHGAFYYLLRTAGTPLSTMPLDSSIDLI